ncbi:MAG: DUF3159 domain-containing protein [Marmoricola sp.]
MTEPVTEDDSPRTTASTHTVEQVVRKQLSDALGGVRGMLEAAVPTVAFTVIFLTQHDLKLAIMVSLGCAAVLLLIRIVQRSSVQFVLNAFVGIGIGALFAWRAARGGGDEGEQALAYFLPGLLYNLGYAAVMVFTIVIRWPLVGFIVGSVAGDPTAWHNDRNVVRLCSRLTWLLALPCILRVVVQGPIYLAGRNDWWSTDSAVAALGVAKLAMGWPLQVAVLALMVWLLSRNATPIKPGEPEPHLAD